MSTQRGDAVLNAQLALDSPRSLTPATSDLAASGVIVSPRLVGHAWGFKDGTVFTRHAAPQPGDIALRVETDRVLRRLYVVLAAFRDRPDLATRVNGQPWRASRPNDFRHTVLFEEFTSIEQRNYDDAMRSFHADFDPGFNYKGRYLDDLGDAAAVIEALVGRPLEAVGASPEQISIRPDGRDRARRTVERLTRPSNAPFRAAVFQAQRDEAGRVECSACNLADEDVLEAAHLVDQGYAEDAWWNGLPMCRNHHRLFDLGRLQLEPGSLRWTSYRQSPSDLGVTKVDVSGLRQAVSAGAVRWKWDSDRRS